MHEPAVVALCVLLLWFVWRDLADVFIEWYSGADPPIPVGTKVWIGVRTVAALAAGITAVLTW